MMLKLLSLILLFGLSLQTSPKDVIEAVEEITNDVEKDSRSCTFKNNDLKVVNIRFEEFEGEFVILGVEPEHVQRSETEENALLRQCLEAASAREGRRRTRDDDDSKNKKKKRKYKNKISNLRNLRKNNNKNNLLNNNGFNTSPLYSSLNTGTNFGFSQFNRAPLISNPMLFNLGNVRSNLKLNPFNVGFGNLGNLGGRLGGHEGIGGLRGGNKGYGGLRGVNEKFGGLRGGNEGFGSLRGSQERFGGLRGGQQGIGGFRRRQEGTGGLRGGNEGIGSLRGGNDGIGGLRGENERFGGLRGGLRGKDEHQDSGFLANPSPETTQPPTLPTVSADFGQTSTKISSSDNQISKNRIKTLQKTNLRNRNETKTAEERRKDREELRKKQQKKMQDDVKQLESTLDKRIREHKQKLSQYNQFNGLNMYQNPLNQFGGQNLFDTSNTFGFSQYRSADE